MHYKEEKIVKERIRELRRIKHSIVRKKTIFMMNAFVIFILFFLYFHAVFSNIVVAILFDTPFLAIAVLICGFINKHYAKELSPIQDELIGLEYALSKGFFPSKVNPHYANSIILEGPPSKPKTRNEKLDRIMDNTERKEGEDSIAFLARCMREAESDNQE